MAADDSVDDAVEQLPALYGTALRLQLSGLPPETIAERLGVHPEAVDTVLRLAEAKLRRLRQRPD